MKKRILALLLAAVMVLSMAACNSSTTEESAAPSSAPSADPSAEPSETIVADLTQDILAFSAGLSAKDIVATVHGTEVPADLFLYWLTMNCLYFNSYYSYYGYTIEDYADMLLEDSLSMTAYYILLEEKCMEYGCPLTDEQQAAIQAKLDELGEETYESQKQMYGLTDETMRKLYGMDSYYANLLDAAVPAPTEEELNNYVYQAKHILLATVDTSGTYGLREDGTYGYPYLDAETIAAKKTQAEDILAQINASADPAATFDELMNQYSEDGRDSEGNLAAPDGYTTTTGEMVAAFEEAALALGYGEISGIVESEFGYHIILRGVVDDIDTYAAQYREVALDAMFEEWLAEADIVKSAVLDSLDVADFYERFYTYQVALSTQQSAQVEK